MAHQFGSYNSDKHIQTISLMPNLMDSSTYILMNFNYQSIMPPRRSSLDVPHQSSAQTNKFIDGDQTLSVLVMDSPDLAWLIKMNYVSLNHYPILQSTGQVSGQTAKPWN